MAGVSDGGEVLLGDRSEERDVITSAPGKVILHGEHSVVYGKVGLVASVSLRTFVRARLTDPAGQLQLQLPDLGFSASWEMTGLPTGHCSCTDASPSTPGPEEVEGWRQLARAGVARGGAKNEVGGVGGQVGGVGGQVGGVRAEGGGPDTEVGGVKDGVGGADGGGGGDNGGVGGASGGGGVVENGGGGAGEAAAIVFFYLWSRIIGHRAVLVTVSSDLPPGSGLGSSAAYSTALSAALLTLANALTRSAVGFCPSDLSLINSWALEGEKIIHGNPSGIDNAVSVYGGALRFQSGKITPLPRLASLRTLLTHTKVPRCTKTLVAGVGKRVKQFPTIMDPLLVTMDAIAKEGEDLLVAMATLPGVEDRDPEVIFRRLETLMEINACLLSALGVSHPAIDAVSAETRRHGLTGTKLTGAGGGGCCITLIPPGFPAHRLAALNHSLSLLGFPCWETSLGSPGVMTHVGVNPPTSPAFARLVGQ